MPAKIETIDLNDLRQRHENGESVLSIARSLGLNRNVVSRCMRDLGLTPRSASEANRIRMARASAADRRALTAAANEERRVKTVNFSPRDASRHQATVSTALTRTRSAGRGETELIDLLITRGIAVETQTPVYGYNLDISVGSVAVEVWWGEGYPVRALRLARRTVEIANLGWSTIFVWLSRGLPNHEAADAVIAFCEESGGRPRSVRPQYRVIRGDGEYVAGGDANADHLALKPTSGNGTY